MSLPNTFNPIIGVTSTDTFFSAQCSLFALEELTQICLLDESTLSKECTIGLYYLFDCISEAIRYEVLRRN